MEASAGERLALIAESYARLMAEPLVPQNGELWTASKAVVAHGTEQPPLFFYGNAVALALFRMTAEDFIGLPSHRSAAPAQREERARMLAQLEARDVVTNYCGTRIAADGSRFVIHDAIIWNIVAEDGKRHGQAATFTHWSWL